MIRFPKNRIWRQDNNSDLYGDIWSSFNLDLSSELGKLKTTRLLNIARSVDDGSSNYTSGLGLAAAFRFYGTSYYAATNGTISKSGTERTGAWGLDSTSGKPTTVSSRYSDMEVFNECLYITTTSANILYKLNGSTWSNIAVTGQDSSKPHALCAYSNRLYVQTDYAKIQSLNTANSSSGTIGTASSTLDLTNPTENTITCMRATSNRIWILTINRNGGKGYIYAWDGNQTSINESYRLESSGAMAGVVKDDVLYVIDADGRLLAFNGGTFVEIDRLPIKHGEYLKSTLLEYNERWIHPNGMTVKDSAILININNEYRGASATWEENIPSGIWEWTKETGLYHKYSFSLANDNSTTSLRDYGQNQISLVGALFYTKSTSTASTDNGSLLAAAQIFYDASNTENVIAIDDLNNTVQKFGYLVTPKIFSEEINDTWQKLITRIKKIATNDEITFKFRTEDTDPLDIVITTWSGSGTVKTTTDISAYDAGDEIEFTRGEGSGKCFKILSKTDLGGGVTEIKLDGEFTSIDSSGKARLQHWKQIGVPFTSTSEDIIDKALLNIKNSAWVQFKVCVQNTGNSYIYDMTLLNTNNQKQ